MANKSSTMLKIRKAIVARVASIHVNDVIEEMGIDVDRMGDKRYTTMAKLIKEELSRTTTVRLLKQQR